MAAKTTRKTAGSKPAARKAAASKAAPARPKVAPKKKEPEDKPAAKPATIVAPLPKAASKARPSSARHVESVSLIDEKKPRQKSVDGEVKKKTAVLPPISRIRASMKEPAAPPTSPPAEAAKVEEEFIRETLRIELGREPTSDEVDEWLREHTEGY